MEDVLSLIVMLGGIVGLVLIIKVFQLCTNVERIERMVRYYLDCQARREQEQTDKEA